MAGGCVAGGHAWFPGGGMCGLPGGCAWLAGGVRG